MRLLFFSSLIIIFAATSTTVFANNKISAKEFVAKAMSSNTQVSPQLIEHKGVSWFPKTQIRAERKGFDRNEDQTDSVGLRIYNSGLLSYGKKKKMSAKVGKLMNISRMQSSNISMITYYEQYIEAYMLKNNLQNLNQKIVFLRAKKKNSPRAIDQLIIKETIDATLLDIQLTKESIKSWSESMKLLGMNIDIKQIQPSLISPKQALINLKSSGVITANTYSDKIQLEKDITQLELDLEVDERRKLIDRLDVSYDRKDDGEKVYSIGLTFNVPFLEGNTAQNNFKNIRSVERINQLQKEALSAKVISKKISSNFTFKSQKLQKDLNDIKILRGRVKSFKNSNFKMYSTLFEHLLEKQMRYTTQYREFLGLYLQQLSFSDMKLSIDKDYLGAL